MDFTEAWDDTCSRIGVAARTGDCTLLIKLIRQGLPVDVEDNRGWRPLHEAAVRNHANCVKLLLVSKSTNVNWRTYEGHTALLLACRYGHQETVCVLLNAGADPNCCDGDITTLIAAVSCKSLECVEMLVEKKANINLINLDGWSALHEAAQQGFVEAIPLLLDRGANITLQDDNGRTALFVAAEHGQLLALELLYERSKIADINDVEAGDGTTPLIIASQGGHVGCIQFLIEKGSKVERYSKDGITAVHLAAHKGSVEALKVLLQHTSAEAIERGTTARFGTPLHVAASADRHEAAAHLIENGFRTDFATEDFELENILCDIALPTRLTPLGEAARCGSVNCMQVLLNAGVNANATSEKTVAPLTAAVLGKSRAVVKLLLGYGSNVNYHGNYCKQPEALLIGAKSSCFELLLNAGGDVSSFLNQEPAKVIEWLTGITPNNRMDFAVVKKQLGLLANHVTNWNSVIERLAADPVLLNVARELRKSEPGSLTHLSRLAVRELLISSGNLIQCVKQLPIPPCLQDYLLYDSFKT